MRNEKAIYNDRFYFGRIGISECELVYFIPSIGRVATYTWFVLRGTFAPDVTPTAVWKGFTLVDLAVLRLQHLSAFDIGT